MANPTAKLVLYMAASIINAIRIKFPKMVSKRLTKREGTANITSHNTTSNVINPTTRFKFLREKTLSNEIEDIIYYICKKKLNANNLK